VISVRENMMGDEKVEKLKKQEFPVDEIVTLKLRLNQQTQQTLQAEAKAMQLQMGLVQQNILRLRGEITDIIAEAVGMDNDELDRYELATQDDKVVLTPKPLKDQPNPAEERMG
jgi:hypothetical protein